MRRTQTITVFGKQVDLTKNAIRFKGKTTSVQPRLVQLLLALYKVRGEVVSKEALILNVWPDTIVTEDSLTKAVSKLRKILDADLDESSIQTISGIGYVLRKPVLRQYIKEQRLPIILSSTILLLLYILLGSGIVEWAVSLSSQLAN